MARARRRWILLILLLLPLMAEFGLRAVAHLAHMERGMEFHPHYGWRPVPRIEKRGRYWGGAELAWTNGRGWRDADAAPQPLPGKRRVVAIGDSFTFGVGVDYGERFTELLEQGLADVEVVNLGVTGYGTDQQLRVLELEGLGYRPDLVLLLSFLSNDLEDVQCSLNMSWPKPWYERRGDELLLHPPAASLRARARSASYLFELLARAVEHDRPHWRYALGEPMPDPDAHYLALVERIHGVCEQASVPLLVALAYARECLDEGLSEDERGARDGLARSGVPMLDTFDLFDKLHYAPDGHWNAAGHRLFARELAARVAELLGE